MDDPRQGPGPGMNNPGAPQVITAVEKMTFPEGSGFGFNLLDEQTKKPIFRLVFETQEDAEEGRGMMDELIQHCLMYEVPED
jgi:hypothetical protein